MSQNTPQQPQDPRHSGQQPYPGPIYQNTPYAPLQGDQGPQPFFDPNDPSIYGRPAYSPPTKKKHTKCKIAGGALLAAIVIGSISSALHGGGTQETADPLAPQTTSAPVPAPAPKDKPADDPSTQAPAHPKFHPHSLADVQEAVADAGITCQEDWQVEPAQSGMDMAVCGTTDMEVMGVVYSDQYSNLGGVWETLGPDNGMAGYYYTSGKTWVIVSDTQAPIDTIHDTVTGGHEGQY